MRFPWGRSGMKDSAGNAPLIRLGMTLPCRSRTTTLTISESRSLQLSVAGRFLDTSVTLALSVIEMTRELI
eukprot:4320736-Amphidinium_carterae.1